MPKDTEFVRKLIMSRNRFPLAKQVIEWIYEANSGKNLDEYKLCNTDEEIANVIRKDAKSRGLVEV